MSMNPGVTAHPLASSSRPPRSPGPISRITPSTIRTSASNPDAPVPSTTVPPRTTISAVISAPLDVAHPDGRRSGGGAAVDRQDHAGDLRRTVAREEHDRAGHVVGTAGALERLHPADDLADVVVRVDVGGDV